MFIIFWYKHCHSRGNYGGRGVTTTLSFCTIICYLTLSCAIPVIEATWDNKLYQKASLLLMGDYHPKLDISPLLSDDNALLFASYIGILQWANEIGGINLT